MNLGKTGCFLTAMTGRCGQTSGTTTVAGRSPKFLLSLSLSESSSRNDANDFDDVKSDGGNLWFANTLHVPDDSKLGSKNRREYRVDRLMEYWRSDVKLLCRSRFDCEKMVNLLDTTRSSEFIFFSVINRCLFG